MWEYADRVAEAHGFDLTADRMPLAGTPAWCELDDDDPVKLLAALLRAAQASLADDTRQADLADASRAIAAAAPWRAQAQLILRGRGPAYIPRRKKETSK